jgi:hypothetical protein
MRYFLIIILLKISFGNFQKTVDNRSNISVVEFDKIKEEKTVTASQLFKNVTYVRLETRVDNNFARIKWFIGKKFIIGYAKGLGFYQFTVDGKYIRKLASFGRGPQEVYYPTWTISQDESHIYIYDQLKPKNFLNINLISGSFEKNIPIPLEGFLQNFELINDSILICAPISGEGKAASNYSLFWQSISGRLLKTLPSRIISKPIIPSENFLYRVGDQLHFKQLHGDTIFNVNGYKLEPYFIFKSEYLKGTNDEGGLEVYLETPDFILLTIRIPKSKELLDKNTIVYNSVNKDYFIDKRSGKTYLINKFINDFIGEQWMPSSFINQNSPKKYISLEASSIIRVTKDLKSNSNTFIKNQDKLIGLADIMTEFDNPVLVIEAE